MNALKLTAVLSLVATVALAGDAQPELVTKEATGEAAIVDNNRDKAFQDARAAALRDAVEQVVGVLVSSTTLTSNNQLISDKILSKTEGYVRKYEILDKKEEKGVMKVTVRAQVGAGQIDKDLQAMQALVQQLGTRRLVILLQEQTVTPQNVSINTQTMTAVLSQTFAKDGWTLLDPNFAMGKLRLTPGATTLTNTEAKEIGDLTQADYILYGTVVYRQQPPGSGLIPELDSSGRQLLFFVMGEYDLAFFETDSGSQLTKVTGRFGSDEVVGKVRAGISYENTAREVTETRGSKIVDAVRAPIAEYLRNAMMNGSRVVVKLVGLPDYGAAQGFVKVLTQSLNGVRDMSQVNYANGKAQVDLIFLGTAATIAEAMSGKTYKGKKVSVTGVTGNTVEITLAK
jgi:Flagellar assembly protein T, N-terminal domain